MAIALRISNLGSDLKVNVRDARGRFRSISIPSYKSLPRFEIRRVRAI
jgi:outer membrane usher protein FimD/PapC